MMTGVDDIFVLPFVGPQECLKATCAQFTLRLNAKDGVIDLETNSEVDAGRISPGAFVGCSRASKSRRSAMLCAARGLREPQKDATTETDQEFQTATAMESIMQHAWPSNHRSAGDTTGTHSEGKASSRRGRVSGHDY